MCVTVSTYTHWLQVSTVFKQGVKPPKPDADFLKNFLSGTRCLVGVSCVCVPFFHSNTFLYLNAPTISVRELTLVIALISLHVCPKCMYKRTYICTVVHSCRARDGGSRRCVTAVMWSSFIHMQEGGQTYCWARGTWKPISFGTRRTNTSWISTEPKGERLQLFILYRTLHTTIGY